MKQLFPLLLLALTLTACNAKKVNDEEVNSEELEQFDDECCFCPHFHIKFQPFGDFSEKEARTLADIMKKEMEKMNDSVPATIDILPVKPLPKVAYSSTHGRDTFSRKHAVCATCRKRFDRL